jgi:hypothetical protein
VKASQSLPSAAQTLVYRLRSDLGPDFEVSLELDSSGFAVLHKEPARGEGEEDDEAIEILG